MQRIFQNAKRLISMCLVTLLIVTSAITMLPAPARADNDLVIVKCESGNKGRLRCDRTSTPGAEIKQQFKISEKLIM